MELRLEVWGRRSAVKAQPFTNSSYHRPSRNSDNYIWRFLASSGCCLAHAESRRELSKIVQYIELASKLGTPYIRLLADVQPQPVDEVDDSSIEHIAPFNPGGRSKRCDLVGGD